MDPWFLVEAAPDLAKLIRTAREVNDSQPQYVADMVVHELKRIDGKRVVVLGLTYKADVDDLRESPVIKIVELLKQAGMTVRVDEPNLPDKQIEGITIAPGMESAIAEVDVIAILVAH